MDKLLQTITLNAGKLKEMKYNFRMGIVGIVIILAIGAAFSLLFTFDGPKSNMAGKLFGYAPLIAVFSVALYLAYHLRHDWLDIKAGYKVQVVGTIEQKFVKIRRASGSTTLVSIAERTRHFIRVQGYRYLITAYNFEQCNIGHMVRMYVTPYGHSVIDFEILVGIKH